MADEQNTGGKSLQEIMSADLFASSKGDLVEALKFIEGHGTPLSESQVQAVALLRSLQLKRGNKFYEPIIAAATGMAKNVTPPGIFIDVIEKMTLGGFVTGKVRLSKVFGGDK